MPDIAMLPLISELFNVSIDELLAGQGQDALECSKGTQETPPEVLKESRFSIRERRNFWKHRWLRAHAAALTLCVCAVLGFWGWAVYSQQVWSCAVIPTDGLGIYLFAYNRMAGYVEQKYISQPSFQTCAVCAVRLLYFHSIAIGKICK